MTLSYQAPRDNTMSNNTDVLATIRASSWADLCDCSLRWYARNVLGMSTPTSAAAALGTALHAGTAAFDSSRLPGGSPITRDDAAGVFVDALHHPKEDVVRTKDDDSIEKTEIIGIMLTMKYCGDVAPRRKYLAVEHSFNSLMVSTDYGVVRFTGTTDRIRETPDGRRGISDLKSGKRSVEGVSSGAPRAVTTGRGPQVGLYTLLAEQSLGYALDAPAEIVGLQTSARAHVASALIEAPKLALVGTDEQPGLIEIAAKMLKSGIFPPNPGSILCSAKFCPYHAKCIYRAR